MTGVPILPVESLLPLPQLLPLIAQIAQIARIARIAQIAQIAQIGPLTLRWWTLLASLSWLSISQLTCTKYSLFFWGSHSKFLCSCQGFCLQKLPSKIIYWPSLSMRRKTLHIHFHWPPFWWGEILTNSQSRYSQKLNSLCMFMQTFMWIHFSQNSLNAKFRVFSPKITSKIHKISQIQSFSLTNKNCFTQFHI